MLVRFKTFKGFMLFSPQALQVYRCFRSKWWQQNRCVCMGKCLHVGCKWFVWISV